MDSFPDIRAFSVDELAAFLAELSDEADEKSTTDRPTATASGASASEDGSVGYRRQVLNNKLDLVRAELADRRGRRDTGSG